MIYHGRVENGVVVLDDTSGLPEDELDVGFEEALGQWREAEPEE